MTIKKIEDLGYCEDCKKGEDSARANARGDVIRVMMEGELSSFDAGIILANCKRCYELRNINSNSSKPQYVPESEPSSNYLV